MDNNAPVIAILLMFLGLPLIVLSIPLALIWTHHKRKMLEMRLKREALVNHQFQAQLDALRVEVQSLRDTATQYDMSFDTALQRIDRRVMTLEQGRLPNETPLNLPPGG
jgi:hypothetical protein